MSMHPPDDRPTTVQPTGVQPTTEQLTVAAAPATRRSGLWGQRIPARIGRARTSTVVIGCLFLLLFALHIAVKPDPIAYTTVVDSNTGTLLTVPASLVPSAPATPTAPSSTARAPATTTSAPTSAGTPATTTGTPRSSTPAPRSSSATSTAPRTSSTPSEGATTAAPRGSSEPPPATPAETSVAPTS